MVAGSAALFALSSVGIGGHLGERFMIAIDFEKSRPVFLRFGALAAVGRCITRETDDPTSDILANLIDVDGDGRPDYRLSAHVLGTRTTCEARRFGLWLDRPAAECLTAAGTCGR